MHKRTTRAISLGGLSIGGGAPVMVQSMTNTDTRDAEATLAQIARLEARGCEAVRVAVPDEAAVAALPAIRAGTRLPLIADIHFDYRLAVASLEAGLEGLRINPGNIGPREHVDRVVDAAKAHGAVIRVGVNSGSVEKRLLQQYEDLWRGRIARLDEVITSSSVRTMARNTGSSDADAEVSISMP